jgi:hypothetical protein
MLHEDANVSAPRVAWSFLGTGAARVKPCPDMSCSLLTSPRSRGEPVTRL